METSDRVVNAWKTVREMLNDRGEEYPIASGIGDEEIRELSRSFTTFGVKANDRVSIVFHTSSTTIKKTDLFSSADDASHILVVFQTKPQGTTVRSIVSEAKTKGVTIEFFELTALQYNISRHTFVPKHEKVPTGDIESILKRYYLKSKFHLPLILEMDPMSRYLGLKHGDLVKITRPSPNSGSTVFYRCCKA